MFNALRKIRKSLIGSDRGRKYLFYAIGEIALVVIGILIALQINNWNQQRLLKNEETLTLEALQTEMTNNKEILLSCTERNDQDILNGDSIRMYIGPEIVAVNKDKLMWWLGNTGETTRCLLSTDVLEELRSTGNLKIISNIEIRRQVGQWSSIQKELIKEENDWALEFSQQYVPYTSKWIQWDDIDHKFNFDDPRFPPSKFDYDPKLMFNDFEFENQYAMHYWRMWRLKDRLKGLLIKTNELLDQISHELD